MKEILLISHSSAASGGSEDDFLRLLKYLSKKYKIISIFPAGPRGNEFKKCSDDFLIIKSNTFPFSKFNFSDYIYFFLKSFINIFKILLFIKKKNIDVCFINSSVCFMETLPLLFLNIPFVVSIKEKINPGFSRKIIYRYIKRFACSIIVISKFLEDLFKNTTGDEKCYLIYSGIEINFIDKIQKEFIKNNNPSVNFDIVNIGVISPLKGQEVLIKAVNNLSIENVRVKFIGRITDNNYFLYLKDLVSKLHNKGNFVFKGELNKREVIFNILNSDCVVITSLEEGMSLVLLEALYSEIPVITSKVGVATEIIKDNYNGLLYNQGDYKQLSEQITILVKDKSIYNKIRVNCKSTYTKLFNLENSLKKIEEIILECSRIQ